ncbi:uncharacterized protein K441DRAFT_5161 [Cenococcum geophilum 1.58]|uniref:uncharacterized protein n=1 Tax=Cenococcum geophilum 1.58 TaxID=794803 RepID=UPI00358F4E3E|nr:hypothetical protein K441DRAFT_5161 [Cenococcum geophilum 1.58]
MSHLLYGFRPPETHDLPVTVKVTYCRGTPANRYFIRQPKALQYFYNGELKRARQAGRFELFLDLLYVAIVRIFQYNYRVELMHRGLMGWEEEWSRADYLDPIPSSLRVEYERCRSGPSLTNRVCRKS